MGDKRGEHSVMRGKEKRKRLGSRRCLMYCRKQKREHGSSQELGQVSAQIQHKALYQTVIVF